MAKQSFYKPHTITYEEWERKQKSKGIRRERKIYREAKYSQEEPIIDNAHKENYCGS